MVASLLRRSCVLPIAIFSVSCGPEVVFTPPSEPSEIALTNVIEKGWDLSIREIGREFPEGVFTPGDAEIKVASRYAMWAKFPDVGLEGELSFNQAEWLPSEIVPYASRSVLLKPMPHSSYNQLKTYITDTYPSILKSTGMDHYDDVYVIHPFDDVGDVMVALRAEEKLTGGVLIDITHTRRRRRE